MGIDALWTGHIVRNVSMNTSTNAILLTRFYIQCFMLQFGEVIILGFRFHLLCTPYGHVCCGLFFFQ